MKGHLLDIGFGTVAGIIWALLGNAVFNATMSNTPAIQAVFQSAIVFWLAPAVLVFFGYTRLPIYKRMHTGNWKTMLGSGVLFCLVGFLAIAYLFYGLVLALLYVRLW